jgi:two-component system phosphate regulon response regulator PhoB
VLRRRAPESAGDSVTIGALMLNAATHRITYESQELKLGPTEFKLLHYLMRHTERVHSRSALLDKVWGDHVFIEERTVDVHINTPARGSRYRWEYGADRTRFWLPVDSA